jgi:hypothetical protein
MTNKFSPNSVLPCLMIFLRLRKFLTGDHHPAKCYLHHADHQREADE